MPRPASVAGVSPQKSSQQGAAWSVDLSIAPQGALDRIAANINRRGKRALGLLKTENEFVGVVADQQFEIWERQKRAVHARGRVAARSRGSRIEVTYYIPLRTRVLLGVFFILYLLVALGIATRAQDPSVSPMELLVTGAGAAILGTLFFTGARSQRADLRGFLERVLDGVGRR